MSCAGSFTVETSVQSWGYSHTLSPKLTMTVPLRSAMLADILISSLRLGSLTASAPLTASILGFRGLFWVGCLFTQTPSQLSLTLESMKKTLLAENMTQEVQDQFLSCAQSFPSWVMALEEALSAPIAVLKPSFCLMSITQEFQIGRNLFIIHHVLCSIYFVSSTALATVGITRGVSQALPLPILTTTRVCRGGRGILWAPAP